MKPNRRAQEVRWLLQEKYSGRATLQAKQDMERLFRGEHVDYLIGFVKFLGCRIDLSYKPFLPRPETEYWTQQAIEDMVRFLAQRSKGKKRIHCLDMFAGSGCIGIAVLKYIPSTLVDFAERDKRFLKQILLNIRINNTEEGRYRLFCSDVFSGIPSNQSYDFVFANPPYVALSRKKYVQKSVLTSEPQSAIFGGRDGLFFIRKFLRAARQYLKLKGKLYMEFDSWEKQKIAHLIERFGYQNVAFFKDQYNKWRYLSAIR